MNRTVDFDGRSSDLPRSGPARRRVDILGCGIDRISFEQASARIREAVRTGTSLHIATANVDFVMRARRDPAFARLLSEADLVVADGVPLCWLARLLGEPLAGRVNGTDLATECARIAAETGALLGLAGAGPSVAAVAASQLRSRFPGARVVEIPTPTRLPADEDGTLAVRVRDTGVDILLLALGSPRQEWWLKRHLAATGAKVGIGVGSAFDFISGAKPRAPRWMQVAGLEWSYRLATEPARLSRRYLLDDLPFVWLGLAAVLRRHLEGGSRSPARTDRT